METSSGATTLALDTNTFSHRGLLRLTLRSAEGCGLWDGHSRGLYVGQGQGGSVVPCWRAWIMAGRWPGLSQMPGGERRAAPVRRGGPPRGPDLDLHGVAFPIPARGGW